MDSRRSSLKSQSSGDSKTDNHKHASDKSTEKPGPTSALLQDLLRAKKAESRRASETHNVDSRKARRSFTEPDHLQAHSSPHAPANGMQPEGKYYRRSSGVGLRHAGTREMGARETEEYISKLNKENFSLKLDVFQSRKRADSLNAKLEKIEVVLEKMKTLETENRELRDINDKLVKELENKDQAIKEAVTIICNLEDKMERVGLAMRDTKPSAASSAPKHSTASHHPSSSPEVPLVPITSKKRASAGTTKPEAPLTNMPTNRRINAATPTPTKTPRRIPSSLPTTRGSASAIRSIYQHENMSSVHLSALSLTRPGSLHSLATTNTTNPANPSDDGISSPRLSVLSESSFVSVYGRRPQHTHEAEEGDEDVWFGEPEPTTRWTAGAPPTPAKTILPPTPDTLTPLASAVPSEVVRVASPSPASPSPASPSPSTSSLRAPPSSSGSSTSALPASSSTFMGGAASTRPQASYGTDMMFNGDGGNDGRPRRQSLVARVFRRRSVDETSAGSGGSGGSSGASEKRRMLVGVGRRLSAKIRGGMRGRKGEKGGK